MNLLERTLMQIKLSKKIYVAGKLQFNKDFLDAVYVLRQANGQQDGLFIGVSESLLAAIMIADLLFSAGKRIESYNVAKTVVRLIRCGDKNYTKGFNDEELVYLIYRCKWIISVLTTNRDSEEFMLSASIEIYYKDLILYKVDDRIKGTFPAPHEEAEEFDYHVKSNITLNVRDGFA